jgi:hypothetical protein
MAETVYTLSFISEIGEQHEFADREAGRTTVTKLNLSNSGAQ